MIKRFKNWLNKAYAKWPKRHIRPVIKLTIKRHSKAKYFNLRGYGYTDGDKIVVMLEKDFQRVADIAAKKANKLSCLNFIEAFLISLPNLHKIKNKIKEVELGESNN